MNKKFLFFIGLIFIGMICSAEKDRQRSLKTKELKKQLKSIQGRIQIYRNSSSKEYSKKDRSLIRKKLFKDIVRALAITTIFLGVKKYFIEKVFILNAVTPEDAQRIAGDFHSMGETMQYSSIFRQGHVVRVPGVTMQSNQPGLYFWDTSGLSLGSCLIKEGAYFATYEMGSVGSNNYLRGRFAFKTPDQALGFIERLNGFAKSKGLVDCPINTKVTLEYVF